MDGDLLKVLDLTVWSAVVIQCMLRRAHRNTKCLSFVVAERSNEVVGGEPKRSDKV